MDIKTATQYIRHCVKEGLNVGLLGSPGLGKTMSIEELVRNLTAADVFADQAKPGDENKPVRFIPISLTTKEAVDFSGIMEVRDGKTCWFPPEWIPTGDEPCVVVIDEFPQADQATQLGAQKLIDRALDGVDVSSRAVFIVMGNRIDDNCGVSDIPQHIRNRFSWFEIECNTDAWLEWAEDKDLLENLVSFIRFRPAQLNTFDPDSEAYAYATPRSVTKLGQSLKDAPREIWGAMAAATCGSTFAAEFLQYLEYQDRCPSVEECLQNPETVKLEDDFGVLFALTDALCHYADVRDEDAHLAATCTILHRIMKETNREEIAAKGVRDLGARNPAVYQSEYATNLFADLSQFLAPSAAA